MSRENRSSSWYLSVNTSLSRSQIPSAKRGRRTSRRSLPPVPSYHWSLYRGSTRPEESSTGVSSVSCKYVDLRRDPSMRTLLLSESDL